MSKILAKVVTDDVEESDSVFSVYDPTCGSGSLLLTVQDDRVEAMRELSNFMVRNLIRLHITWLE